MIDEKMLSTLSASDKEAFLQTLEHLISQTYVVENEYKTLQTILKQIIEYIPNAIVVLDSSFEIFLQNSEAKKIEALFEKIDLKKPSQEIEHQAHIFLIKVICEGDKTIITATDITNEKRSERLESMGQIAAHLSHEIRNPIGSVSILASSLLKRVDDKSKPLVVEMKKAIWRVERIIKATLLFTKGAKPNKSHFKLSSMEKELFDAIEHYTFSKDIDFSIALGNAEICADFDLMCIVLQNFLFNAIDAIEEQDEESGAIQIYVKKKSKMIEFIIKDTGVAIADDNILFEPFKTTKTKGHGLGLALSLQIVDSHQGSISLLEDTKGFSIQIGAQCE